MPAAPLRSRTGHFLPRIPEYIRYGQPFCPGHPVVAEEGYLDDQREDHPGARSYETNRDVKWICRVLQRMEARDEEFEGRPPGRSRGGGPRGGSRRSALAGRRGGGGAVTDDRRGNMNDGNKGKSVARSVSARRASTGTGSSHREADYTFALANDDGSVTRR